MSIMHRFFNYQVPLAMSGVVASSHLGELSKDLLSKSLPGVLEATNLEIAIGCEVLQLVHRLVLDIYLRGLQPLTKQEVLLR